ncbi:hypothetical protein NIES4102_19290 [Chondrocystis sp. NIES-4102]|nr:hypothetical protein NIES4102_19290 [Chondrocystis sp. NIES-4102]
MQFKYAISLSKLFGRMDDNLINKIKQDFDRIALLEQKLWDHNRHYHSFLLKQLPIKGNIALDIGCGTGDFSRLLAQRFNKVIALDLSPTMIAIAKQRSQAYQNIEFLVGDILKWHFPLEKFDAIASIATVHHLPLDQLLPSLKSALKCQGKLVILDLVRYEYPQDILREINSLVLNPLLTILINGKLKASQEELEAWQKHASTDTYLTLTQAKEIYSNFLEKAKIMQHLFWRYSVVWQKP